MKQRVDMLCGNLLGNVIRYSIPIILSGVLQYFFNAADLIVVGRFGSEFSVGAVGATGALVNLIIAVFMGLSIGAGVAVAQAAGAGDNERVHRSVHTAITAAFFCGVFLMMIGFSFSRFFLGLMKTPEDIIDLSSVYMRIYFLGVIPIMLYNFGASILRAVGETKKPLYFLSIAGVINVLLNLLFVIVCKMDVAGVALATTISQTVSCVLVLLTLMKRDDACRLITKKLKIHKENLLFILKVGIPAGIQGSMFSISNVIIQSAVNEFGGTVVSGCAAAGNIESFVWIAMNSFSHTALNFVSQNVGARRYERINKIVITILVCVAVLGIVGGVGIYLLAEPLLSIYLKDSADKIAYGVVRMKYVCLPYVLCGVMDTMTGALRGMGASLVPMIVSVMGICVFRVGWIWTVFRIPEYHTIDTVYISYPISWILTFAVLIICFAATKKRVCAKCDRQDAGALADHPQPK